MINYLIVDKSKHCAKKVYKQLSAKNKNLWKSWKNLTFCTFYFDIRKN